MKGEQRDARCIYFKAERRDSNWYMKGVKVASGDGWEVSNSDFDETLASLEKSVNRDIKRGIDTLYRVKGTNARYGNYGYGNTPGNSPFVLQEWEFMTSEFEQFKNLFVNSIQYVDAQNELSSWTDDEIEDSEYYASTKKSKMRKGMDIDGVFDDSYQQPHGKYVLHLNLNGDSFYPKYFDDEESFNREVQRAIDNGYTESDWSNYSDNEGLHRRFARDDWGKSAKKSYTPDYMDFRSMVDSIKNTGNHNKVFKE